MSEMLFVDPAVDYAETLTDSVRSGIQIHALPETGDALAAVAGAMTGRRNVPALHILSHGAPGTLRLSGTAVDLGAVARRPALVAAIRAALADDAEIVLYGCSVAEGAGGAAFVESLSELFDCAVTAAGGPVGAAASGGTWPAPVRVDSAFGPAARAAYPGLLPVFTFATVTTINTTTTLTSAESGVTVSVASSDGQRLITIAGSDGNAVATLGVVNSGTVLTFSFSSSVNVTGFQILQANSDASTGGGIISRGFLSGATVGTQVSAVTADITAGNAGANVYDFSPGDWTGIDSFTITNTGDGGSDPSWHMYVDTISFSVAAPAAPAAPNLIASSDTGSSSTDNITSNSLPTIDGTAVAGNGVHILVGGVTVGSTTADGGGNWTFTFTSTLAAGTNVITAVQDTGSAESAASTALTVTVDSTAATLAAPDLDAASDTGTSSTDNITSTFNPKIQGDGADAGATVHVIDDGVTVGSVTATGTGTWSFTFTTSLSEGSNAITVVQTDVAGNTGTASAVLGVTVDTTAPTTLGPPDLLAASDTGVSSTDNETNSPTQQFTGSATDGDIVSILVGGATANIATAVGGSWSYTHTLTAGSYAVTVQATDLAGNAGAVSSALGLTIDTASPGTVGTPDLLASSDSGSNTTDNITNVALPTISGSGAVANGLVQILVGGVTAGSVTASVVGAWTFTFTATLSAGTHVITAATQDIAGNQGPASAALTVTVDTAAATLAAPDLDAASDTGTSSTDNITSTFNPKIQGDGADAGATVHVIDDGVTVGSVTATGTGTWSFTFTTSLSEGTSAITVVQTDLAGNASSPSTALNVVLDTTAPTTLGPPDLLAASDLGVSSVDNITSATTQQFSGSASDGDRVHLIVNAVTTATVVAAGGSWTHTTSLTSGSYGVSVSVTDAVGNAGPASAALDVVVDHVAPTGTVGTPDLLASSDLGTSPTDNLTSTAVPTIAGDGGEANNLVQILVGGVTVGATTASGAGAWTFTFTTSLSSGTNTITAQSQDVAGNDGPSSTALNVVIDLTAPAAPGTLATADLVAASDTGTSSTDNLTTDATPSFSGTNTTGSELHALLANGVTAGMFTSDVGGTYNVTASSLTAGSYAITIREVDTAGNASTDSPALGITIETAVAPTTESGGSSGGGTTTTTTTTTSTTNPTTGTTTTTQTQTVQNTSSSSTGSAAIVENTNNNGNVVTATLPAQTSITSEGPTTAQTRDDALTTLITAVDARDSTGESKLITGVRTFLNKLSSTTTLDVRTIIPTTTSASLSTPIVITGTSAAAGSTQSEAFVIDVRSLPSGTTLQLDNIEFASIIGSATVNGGSGDNYAVGDDSDQFISLGEGDDTLFGGEGNDTIGSASGNDSLGGDEGDDVVFGGTGNDTAFGDAGADAVYGNQENDILYGNLNNDTIYGGQDSDTAFGGQDDDVIYGNLAADSLSGQLGDDTIYGGQGDDLVYGGQGDDLLFGNLASDTLSGGAGDDTVSGEADADVLYGGAGNDHLDGGAGQDTLYGGTPGSATGIDVLDGGDGDDVIYGGEGIDWIYSGTGSDAIYVEASNGFDVLVDFDSSAGDVIHLATNVNGSGIASFSDIQAEASDNADGNVEIALGSNNFVRIVGVTSSQLTSDMFQFF